SNAALNWLAKEQPDLEIVRSTLHAIVQDSERAANVFTRIRALLSRSAQPYQLCDLRVVIRETLPLVRAEFARNSVRVEIVLAPELPSITGDAIQLQQVLLNLLINAIEASREVDADRRLVTVQAAIQHADTQPHVGIRVRDGGSGIAPADL